MAKAATSKTKEKAPAETAEKRDFKARYAALNPEQREAVDALQGPVMVIAGPGTGKTTVLTLRIANILSMPKRAGSRRKAPREIKEQTRTHPRAYLHRIRRRRNAPQARGSCRARCLQSRDLDVPRFSNRIIQDYPDHFPEIVGASPITEIEQVDIVRRLLDSREAAGLKLAKLRPFGAIHTFI